MGHVEDDSWLL